MRALCILLLLSSLVVPSAATDIPNLRVSGRATRAEVQGWIKAVPPADSARVAERIVDSLFARGCFGAAVHRAEDTLVVAAGNQYRISGLRVLGDSLLLSAVDYARFELRPGVPAEAWRVESAVEAMLTLCENRAHPFAQVDVDSLQIDETAESVVLHLKLLGGPRIALDFIEFEGNAISQSRLLRRESGLRPGEPYDARRVKLAQRKLAQLEYLRRVSAPRLVINDAGQSGLLFAVQESRLSRLDVVAGLSPEAEGEAQTVTGLADLQFLNLFGTGRRGKIYWQRPASGVQELSLAWREVWLAGTPLRADASFAQRVEDTLYVTRRYGARLAYPLGAGAEIFTGIAREELLADSGAEIQLDLVANHTVLLEGGLSVDTRDHLSNPRSGLRFETSAARGQRMTDHPPAGSTKTEFEQRRAALDFEVNHEPWLYWILHGSVHARLLLSDEPEIPVSDLHRIGGARTLRGYREEQFLGSEVSWATIEARYWLGPASRLALFTDGGVISREYRAGTSGDRRPTLYRTAYGVGLRLETGVGVWGVDYGIASGDSPLNGQLHVSLLSLF
ncbi:MAG: BamA/TamA family outer membrane protein [bacterium]|nr:BamA/TamA family outer membrane protein [bacterium]